MEPVRDYELRAFFTYVIEVLERLGIPYMVVGGFAAIMYGEPRLTIDYFNGRRGAFERAQAEGAGGVAAFFRVVFPSSLPMCALAGATSFMLGGSSLLWPLVMVNGPDLMPLSLRTLMVARAANAPGMMSAAGWQLLVFWGVAMLVVWGVTQAVYGERLQLDVGDEPAEAPPVLTTTWRPSGTQAH